MKRAHRKWHLALWALIGPAALVVLTLAVMNRPASPVNEALPGELMLETE